MEEIGTFDYFRNLLQIRFGRKTEGRLFVDSFFSASPMEKLTKENMNLKLCFGLCFLT